MSSQELKLLMTLFFCAYCVSLSARLLTAGVTPQVGLLPCAFAVTVLHTL
jgi:hypothetical protein